MLLTSGAEWVIQAQNSDAITPASISYTPEDYAAKLQVILDAGHAVGRDMSHFTPAFNQICLVGDEPEIAEMLEQPMVKSIILMITAKDLEQFGYKHPMGDGWRGIMDFDPVRLSREAIIRFCNELDTQAIRDIFPVGDVATVARKFKGFAEAGMRVFKVMDYGGMAGARFAARSAAKVRAIEDEVTRICAGID